MVAAYTNISSRPVSVLVLTPETRKTVAHSSQMQRMISPLLHHSGKVEGLPGAKIAEKKTMGLLHLGTMEEKY